MKGDLVILSKENGRKILVVNRLLMDTSVSLQVHWRTMWKFACYILWT